MRSLPMDTGMTYFLKQDFQLIPELTDLARLNSQLAPGIHLPQVFQENIPGFVLMNSGFYNCCRLSCLPSLKR